MRLRRSVDSFSIERRAVDCRAVDPADRTTGWTRRRFGRVLLAPLVLASLCCLGPAGADADTDPPVETLSILNLERGQKGYGLSVFEGNERRRFEVEVIGVWGNSKPELSYLLTRLSGQNLEHTGVLGGMSGSPVFFDEKLVGAVAFSFSYGKDPIAGITPIDAMRSLAGAPGGLGDGAFGIQPTAGSSPAPSAASVLQRPTWNELVAAAGANDPRSVLPSGFSTAPLPSTEPGLERLRQQIRTLLGDGPAEAGAPRTGTVWTADGFNGAARTLLESGLGSRLVPSVGLRSTGLRSTGLSSGGGMSAGGGISQDLAEQMKIVPADLQGGDAVAVALVGGDLKLAAHGTVTDRHGDALVAFGHPVYSLGPIRLPMAESEVLTPIASVESSFKLSNAGRLIGVFDQDREPGAHGLLGVQPDVVPVSVTLSGLVERRYEMFVADFYIFKPTLFTLCALGALNTASHTNGYQGVDFKARLRLDGYEDLVLEQSFDGLQAGTDGAIQLLTYVAFLELSDEERASIQAVDMEFHQSAKPRLHTLESVRADRRRVKAGDTVRLQLGVKAPGGERQLRHFDVEVPASVPPGRWYLMVGDGTSMDAARLAIEPGEPRDLAASIEMINGFSSRKSLQVMGLVAAQGATVEGHALPALPGSMRSVLAYGDAVRATELRRAGEWSEDLDAPLDGIHRVDLIVER